MLIILIMVVIYFWEVIIVWIIDGIISVISTIIFLVSCTISFGILYFLYRTIASFYNSSYSKGVQYLLILAILLVLLFGIDETGLLDSFKD